MSVGFKSPTGYPLEFIPHLMRGGYDGWGGSTFCWYSAIISKRVAVVLKETKECRFWLKLIQRSRLIGSEHVEPTIQEWNELCAIIAKSILTARRSR